MGVAAALVVMEKRALFRIIFLDQKKDLFNFCLWQHMLAKETIFVLLQSYIILESSKRQRFL